jgi:hypothetical protein
MPQYSAGLAVEIPARPPQLVYPPSFPFKKLFAVYNAMSYSVLEFDVWTSYETWDNLADVRINGVSIGKIPPKGWAQNGYGPVCFQFANVMFNTHVPVAFGRTGFNEFEIIPPTYDYLVVGNWRFHYYQLLQP